MLKRLGILASAIALLGSVAGGITIALASGDITAPETIVLSAHTTKEAAVDVGKKGFGPGDQFLFQDALYDETGKTRMGSDQGHCTLAFRGWAICEVALFLTDRGEITGTGAVPATEEAFDFPLTGGTGDFENVRGSAHVEPISEQEERITLNLLP